MHDLYELKRKGTTDSIKKSGLIAATSVQVVIEWGSWWDHSRTSRCPWITHLVSSTCLV